MDTKKLITVVVWATVVLVAYEVYKSLFNSSTSSQLGGGTTGEVASGLAESVGNLLAGSSVLNSVSTPLLTSPSGLDTINLADDSFSLPNSSDVAGFLY
jgi:hypothetical protein